MHTLPATRTKPPVPSPAPERVGSASRSRARSAKPNVRPAYLQRKLAMSQPGDADEREADRVAREVVSAPGPRETEEMIASAPVAAARSLSGLSDDRKLSGKTGATDQSSVRQAARHIHPASMPLRRNVAEQEQLAARRLQAQASDEEEALSASRLMRQADLGPETGADEDTVDADIEARIDALRGTGRPLPEELRQTMESRFGEDFSHVGIHTDDEADALCRRLHARAFAVGHDLFFAHGEFAPDTPAGRELLAHELTHVVQQRGGAQRKLCRDASQSLQRTQDQPVGSSFAVNTGEYAGTRINTAEGARSLSLPRLRLPSLKRRNSGLFPVPLLVSQQARRHTYQTDRFREAVNGPAIARLGTLTDAARQAGALDDDPLSGEEMFFFALNNNAQFLLFGTQQSLLPRLEIPIWDQAGRPTNFQVDHICEMQLRGDDLSTNYELLEGEANMGAGRAIAGEIRDTIKGGLQALKTAHPDAPVPAARRWSWVKANYDVSFAALSWNLPHDGSENAGRFWSLGAIQAGTHARPIRPMSARERAAIGAGGPPRIYASAQGGTALPSIRNPRQNWIPRVDLVSWTPSADDGGPVLGSLVVSAYKASSAARRSAGVATAPDYPDQSWTVMRIPGINAGYVDSASYTVGLRNSLRLPGMSPIQLDTVSLSEAGIIAEGQVLTTVALIDQADIRISINGAEAMVYKTFTAEELNLPAPLRIDTCDLTVFFSTARGLGLSGRADFGVDRLGEGHLAGQASTEGGFALEGGFSFDSRLFDRADIALWYRSNQLGGRGTIGIDSPEKIRGIRAAEITVEYLEGSFAASGSVQPDIPGVQEAALQVAYSEDEGLTIGGRLQLAANPAIRSGSIDVVVNKHGEDWRLSATGTAQPAIPGVDAELTVSYEDGAFLAEASATYQRGMLAGEVSAGATNRSLDEQGRPTGPAQAGNPIIVYGSGAATLRLSPWLQGRAGIRFAPDGEVTVTGEIGLPDAVEVFPRREISKSLFNVAIQAPIVPGIVAEIGGSLSAQAGIGAGRLEALRVGVTYNPAREQDTRIDGEARLNVPADAGLRLALRAGIGLGITGASATGGLEIGGTLGVQGAAMASVMVAWTPTAGLNLDADVSVHAQPSFTFDVSGYVSVRALGFSVYDESWRLASYEFGSDYRFGISLPVRYRDGEPFDVRLEDVRFEVPSIDTSALLRGLVRQIV